MVIMSINYLSYITVHYHIKNGFVKFQKQNCIKFRWYMHILKTRVQHFKKNLPDRLKILLNPTLGKQ